MTVLAFRLPAASRALAAPLALAFCSSIHAQSPLPETVVTATRLATRADELVSDVRVIDRAAIEASAARTLPELLARRAGVQMSANGGRGKTSSVFIRGTESRHTLLLVDGVRVGSATAGTPTWESIPVEMIERIEVLQGPASALYGSDAVGGVVQVFTRKGREGFHPNASVGAGSRGYAQAGAGVAGGAGALTYSLSLQREREDGINSTRPSVSAGNYNPDLDPFRQDSAVGSIGWQIAPDWALSGGFLHSEGVSNFDDGPRVDARNAIRTSTLHAGVKGRVAAGWRTELRLSGSQDTANSLVATTPGAFQTEQMQWTWQNDVETPVGVLLAGLEQREQQVSASTAYTVTRRTIDSFFTGLSGSRGAHSWQGNLRRDRNSQFGSADTGFAGYGYRLAPAWRVHGSYGTSFVAPSFNQLYFPGFGNPALQPERGRNTDLGVTWSEQGHEVRLGRFDNRIRGFMTNTTLPVNIPRARIEGWTLGYAGQAGRTSWRADLEALDPRNQLNDRRLPRRAREQLSLGADHQLGAWRLGASLLAVGSRFDDAANARRLGGYTTADLYADWQFARDFALQAKLVNLADKRYETAYGYNQPGRGAFVTLRWQPK
ncbi:MAG TPA: TonB-dependent receptor [Ramlibacter sp.]|jgi:vitamin B12 transporter|uniref:TonB-dependent receptor domain-containing protein n=1 Tax=Ramlibacter sp. TaxID=1917967 RepID=UPI002D3B9B11|nr:TonB-dependent receptor [Ramlibacter sp.]HZY18069.1 TonB-dependent receptor [Ramlibacter sp.]